MTLGHGPYGRGDYGAGLYGTDETAEFPQGALRGAYEFLIDGDWVDVTPLVLTRDGTPLSHGQADEGSSVDFAKLSFSLNNRDGTFSPRNPLSPYYGKLGRSTQVRHSVRYGPCRLVYTGAASGGISTPDSAALDILGDIDVRVDASDRSWYQSSDLAFKYGSAGDRSWYFHVVSGYLTFTWSADGTALITSTSTVPITWPAAGRIALRATLDVNNGAAGNTVTFYYSANIDAAAGWTQLGDAVVTAGTTSIFNSTAGLSVGVPLEHQVYAVQVYSGIAGTLKASADFRLAGDEDVTFVGATGETWTFGGNVKASNQHYRFWGEISSMPVRWDSTGRDVWVPLQASGPLRRLGTRTDVLQSTLRRSLPSTDGIVAYWPCEDGDNSLTLASALGGPALSIVGSPDLASFGGYPASGSLPLVSSSRWSGAVPAYTGTGEIELRVLLAIPSSLTNGATLFQLTCTGTAPVWRVNYLTGGDLNVTALDSGGASILTSATADFNLDGTDAYIYLRLQQSGADILWVLGAYIIGASGGSTISASLNTRTVSQVYQMDVAPNRDVDGAAVGHIVLTDAVNNFLGDQFDALVAYDTSRESAAGRVSRLGTEESVPMTLIGLNAVGVNDSSQVMGPQGQKTLLDLLRETEAADLGVLYESTSEDGLVYRPRVATYNRLAAATLSYSSVELSGLDQTDDDRGIQNDITVTRLGGSSYRIVQLVGPLNVSDPTVDPAGVGRYVATPTINVDVDVVLPDHAGWRLRQGTVDEARYPVVQVNLANAALGPTSNAVLELLELREGDRLVITDPRPDGGVDDISLVVLGWIENSTNFEWTIEFNCAPDSPHRVGIYGDTGTRYSSDGSTLGESLTTATTSFLVATPTGPVWGHGDGDFDIAIGGERMTVTAVSGSTSPQTFTVTRAVNGISKTHTAADPVELWQPAYYAL